MATAAKKTGRDVNEFRAAHDRNFIVPKKIEEGLKKLGPDKWEYQVDFLQLAQLSVTDCALFRDQFSDFIVELGGKNSKLIWCGSKELAKKLRAMI